MNPSQTWGRRSMNLFRSVAWPRAEHTSPELRKRGKAEGPGINKLEGA